MYEEGDGDDYESLPSSSTPLTHMCAGAAAGIMEHCLMYPVDCVKTRMQVLVPDPRAQYRNVLDAFYRIVRYEGARITFRGINATAYGAGPAHAMYFAAYENVKKRLYSTGTSHPIAHGIAGCCATFLHDAVMNPADVIKQRMQVFNSPHRTCLDCARTVLRTEGPRAFYRSYTTQLTMNVPFQSLHFILYEFSQDLINADRRYSPSTHMVSGALAGAVAAGATTPLDVCKTLLNTQEHCREHCEKRVASQSVTGLVDAFRTVYRFSGTRGFFNGLTARVIYQTPSTAISWSVYELFKSLLSKRNEGAGKFGGGDGSQRGSTGKTEDIGKPGVVKMQLHVIAASIPK